MTLTEKQIAKLESKGFKRWTKGDYDRLYINAYNIHGIDTNWKKNGKKTLSINGEELSYTQSWGLSNSKIYIDIKTGEVVTDWDEVKALVEAELNEVIKETVEEPATVENVEAEEEAVKTTTEEVKAENVEESTNDYEELKKEFETLKAKWDKLKLEKAKLLKIIEIKEVGNKAKFENAAKEIDNPLEAFALGCQNYDNSIYDDRKKVESLRAVIVDERNEFMKKIMNKLDFYRNNEKIESKIKSVFILLYDYEP